MKKTVYYVCPSCWDEIFFGAEVDTPEKSQEAVREIQEANPGAVWDTPKNHGDVVEFSIFACDCCKSRLAGGRKKVYLITQK